MSQARFPPSKDAEVKGVRDKGGNWVVDKSRSAERLTLGGWLSPENRVLPIPRSWARRRLPDSWGDVVACCAVITLVVPYAAMTGARRVGETL